MTRAAGPEPGAQYAAAWAAVTAMVLFAMAGTPAAARDRLSYAGARFGYIQVKDVDSGSVNFGILGGLYFAPRVAFEGSLDYHTPDFDRYERETFALQGTVYVYPFTAKHLFRPYLTGGLGWYWSYYTPEEESLPEDNRTSGGFHAGFGFDVLLTKEPPPGVPSPRGEHPAALTFDFRYLFTKNDPDGDRSDGLLASIGLKVGF